MTRMPGAGILTCADNMPPTVCRFLAKAHVPVCVLFGMPGMGKPLSRFGSGPHKGWLARLPECLAQEERHIELK